MKGDISCASPPYFCLSSKESQNLPKPLLCPPHVDSAPGRALRAEQGCVPGLSCGTGRFAGHTSQLLCSLCEPQVSSCPFPPPLLFLPPDGQRGGGAEPGVPQAVLSVPPALFVPNVLGGWASHPARPSPSLWVIRCSDLVGSRGCRGRRARPLRGHHTWAARPGPAAHRELRRCIWCLLNCWSNRLCPRFDHVSRWCWRSIRTPAQRSSDQGVPNL